MVLSKIKHHRATRYRPKNMEKGTVDPVIFKALHRPYFYLCTNNNIHKNNCHSFGGDSEHPSHRHQNAKNIHYSKCACIFIAKFSTLQHFDVCTGIYKV